MINPENQNQNQSSPSLPTEFEILQRQVQQMNGTLGQLTEMLNRPAPVVPVAPSYNIDPDAWADPARAPNVMAGIIQQETQKAIAPLLEFRNQFNRANQYGQIKNQVKNMNPTISKFWAQIEPILDQTFSSGNVDVNPNIVAYQAQAIIGSLAMQNPGMFSAQAQGVPMISPSGAPAPSTLPNTPKLRDLDENEETLRKARGLTQEQFLQLQAGSSMILTPSSQQGKK